MAVLAAAMLASVMPPAICFAIACAMAVTGVTWMPLVVAPAATLGSATLMTSPCAMLIVVPVASSV